MVIGLIVNGTVEFLLGNSEETTEHNELTKKIEGGFKGTDVWVKFFSKIEFTSLFPNPHRHALQFLVDPPFLSVRVASSL